MSPESVTFVNTVVVPFGLAAIMFSLGLSLTIEDFGRALRQPRTLLAGLAGQLLVLPPLAFLIVTVLALPPSMAIGLIILAACPGGVTSNAVSFAVRANVALSVVLTALASLITVFSTPALAALALKHFSVSGSVPDFSVVDTVYGLARITAVPIALGMLTRRYAPAASEKLIVWLRPTSMIVLIAVIGFSVMVSAEMVLDNLLIAGPAIVLLNITALSAGLLLARSAGADATDTITIAIELGIQNVTVATFLTLSVLNDLALAITPTIYGVFMLLNAMVLVQVWRRTRLLGTSAQG